MAVRELMEVAAEDVSGLEDDELVYLLQRNRHAPEAEKELRERDKLHLITGNQDPLVQLHNAPNHGDANTKMLPPPRTRQEGEEDESYLEELEVDPKNLTKPQLVGAGIDDDDDDDDEGDFEIPEGDPDKSWTNDQLRAELQRLANEGGYEVDLDGNKDKLIARVKQNRAAAQA